PAPLERPRVIAKRRIEPLWARFLLEQFGPSLVERLRHPHAKSRPFLDPDLISRAHFAACISSRRSYSDMKIDGKSCPQRARAHSRDPGPGDLKTSGPRRAPEKPPGKEQESQDKELQFLTGPIIIRRPHGVRPVSTRKSRPRQAGSRLPDRPA